MHGMQYIYGLIWGILSAQAFAMGKCVKQYPNT